MKTSRVGTRNGFSRTPDFPESSPTSNESEVSSNGSSEGTDGSTDFGGTARRRLLSVSWKLGGGGGGSGLAGLGGVTGFGATCVSSSAMIGSIFRSPESAR